MGLGRASRQDAQGSPRKGIGKRDRDVREGASAASGSTGAMTWSAPSRPLLVVVGLVLLIVALRTRLRTAVSRPLPSAGERVSFLREVTGAGMGGPRTRHQLRVLGPTKVLRLPAASTEPTPRRGTGRTGNVPGKENTLPGVPTDRRPIGHRGDQSLGVGMTGVLVDLGVGTLLHGPPEIHPRDPGGDVPDHGQIMGDEDVGETELALQLFQQVDDLRLDGNI